MAKPSITTRTAKGSPLTIAEMDANLTNLRDTTITFKAPSNRTQITSIGGMYEASEAQVKFGARSLRFNGSTHGVNMNWMPGNTGMNPFNFGMSEFSIEMWVWIDDAVTTNRYLLDMRGMTTSDNALSVYLNNANNIVVQRGETQIAITSTPLASAGWRHIAIERASYMGTGATLTAGLYIITDGAINGTGWQNTMDSFVDTTQVYIGQDRNSSNRFQGYIDEFRMSSTVRYLKNTMSMANTFPVSVPTAAFLNDYSTKVLLHFDEQYSLVDDAYDAMEVELGSIVTIQEGMYMNTTVTNSTKQINIGVDLSSYSAPKDVAFARSDNMYNGAIDWMEENDSSYFLNIMMGSGQFQIQNSTTMSKDFVIEIYGVMGSYTSNSFTTPLTGVMELYDETMTSVLGTYSLYDGFIPNIVKAVNIPSNTSRTYKYRVQNATNNEDVQGNLILKVTRI